MNDDADLLRHQEELQREADHVAADLRLDDLLAPLGRPVRVGSSAMGLMVWRDLDVTVVCPSLSIQEVASVGARLGEHPRVRQVVFRNDTGAWNTDPGYPDGLYLGPSYRGPSGHDWKIDIWFIAEPERQPDLAHLTWIPAQLDRQRRTAILRIKALWAARPEYGRAVTSFDIYQAVLRESVSTPEEFDGWLSARRPTPG